MRKGLFSAAWCSSVRSAMGLYLTLICKIIIYGSSTDECLKKAMEFFSALQRMQLCSLMELEIIMLGKPRQFHKDKCHMCSLICGS
jgi:hypothetical protein